MNKDKLYILTYDIRMMGALGGEIPHTIFKDGTEFFLSESKMLKKLSKLKSDYDYVNIKIFTYDLCDLPELNLDKYEI